MCAMKTYINDNIGALQATFIGLVVFHIALSCGTILIYHVRRIGGPLMHTWLLVFASNLVLTTFVDIMEAQNFAVLIIVSVVTMAIVHAMLIALEMLFSVLVPNASQIETQPANIISDLLQLCPKKHHPILTDDGPSFVNRLIPLVPAEVFEPRGGEKPPTETPSAPKPVFLESSPKPKGTSHNVKEMVQLLEPFQKPKINAAPYTDNPTKIDIPITETFNVDVRGGLKGAEARLNS